MRGSTTVLRNLILSVNLFRSSLQVSALIVFPFMPANLVPDRENTHDFESVVPWMTKQLFLVDLVRLSDQNRKGSDPFELPTE